MGRKRKSKDNERDQLLSFRGPWADNHNNIWLASILRVVRNIKKHTFPTKLSAAERSQVFSVLKNTLLKCPLLESPIFIDAGETNPLNKEYLSEHFFSSLNIQQAQKNEGFVIDQTGSFLGIINVRNHLQIQLTDSQGELETTWHHLTKIEAELANSFEYAFSPRFGFLTADPTHCGTGLIGTIYLHLPALIHTGVFQETVESALEEGVVAQSMQGSLDEIVGDLVVLQNSYTLGLTEETILSILRTSATTMMTAEKRRREELRTKENADVKDRVSRAYGLLKHSYKLTTIEALKNLSLFKLGLELDWITGIPYNKINELLINCQRAHLMSLHQKSLNQEELPQIRAELIHKTLKETLLKTA
ncbi:protein arginine kinase [Simkania negevensis]|uniref:Protein arginine kinase n=1 Tax=Simkania negevensis TaxID=83561 RepID=A0ABS3AQC4_9BACT|nr:protein arginine kinase [Simkania negevensis]